MSNEAQYYSPIVQAMIEGANRQQETARMKMQGQQFAAENKLRQQQIDQQHQQIEYEHQHAQDSLGVQQKQLEAQLEQARANAVLSVTKGRGMGIDPSAFGAVSQGSGIPGVEDRTLSLPTGQQIPLSAIPTAQQQMETARAMTQTKEQTMKTPAFMKLELGNDLPDEIPLSIASAYGNLIERKHAAEEANKTKENVAQTQSDWHQYVVDQNNQTKKLIAAMKPSATSSKLEENAAINKAFLDSGGDWNKVAANAAQGAYGTYSAAIADHAAKYNKISPTNQTRVNSAQASMELVNQAKQAIQNFTTQHPDLIGSGYTHPINGMKRMWETNSNTLPPDIGNVDSILSSVAAMQPQQHGFRGQNAINEFKQATGIDYGKGTYDQNNRAWLANPGRALQGLDQIANTNSVIKNSILNGGKSANPTIQTQSPYKVGDVVQHKDGSKLKITQIDSDGTLHGIPQ